MVLAKAITTDTIRLGLADIDKDAAIRVLVDLIVASGRARKEDRDAILAAVLDREAKGSTGLENGIAVPHARTAGVTEVVCALGISPMGIDFDSNDRQPCHLIFLIVAPPQEPTKYLKALSAVASIGRDRSVTSRLLSAASPKDVMAVLAGLDATGP
jgi:mannitol/fructose-specific phosphotransferase system IIA component (Ntr-type)